ncbi:MAG TPA: acyl-[ACP]--phospholipid O-acyltransferase [Elusimicrobia bacterium]|nr:acyl-[ACP]--phospholipid O-acyltransferase [Elusimicrobiota bacterium]
MLKTIVRGILRALYRIEVEGLKNLEKAGDRVLIIANHQSFLDAPLLALFLPGSPLFAVNTFIARLWWLRPFLKLANTFALDPANPMAAKALIAELKRGVRVVVFPEGRITVTGSLMKVYEGPGMIADKAGARIVPVRLDGAQYTPFSRLKGKVRLRWFPRITIRVLEPRGFSIPPEIRGRARRAALGDKLYGIMTEMLFESSDRGRTLFQGLLDARAVHGGGHKIVVDIDRRPLSYDQLILRSLVLGRQIARQTAPGEIVGVLLPNMTGTIAVFFGLQAFGRVPALINYSTGAQNVLSACATVQTRCVLTSRRFIEKGKLAPIAEGIEKAGVKMIYLEDLAERIGLADKLWGLAASLWPQAARDHADDRTAADAAVVLFTSGSEGTPKGVVLSHENIQANRFQVSSVVDFGPGDKVFNALPIFHSFGLTAASLLPILSGIQVFFYPSPLHYRVVPELVYDSDATILFGTDTFLSGYARFAHPYDFYSLRYVFAGAERLKDETRRLYAEKYGVRIFEGYGATETSPVLAINTPMHHRAGTTGRLMPGMDYRLEPVEGVVDGGRLLVEGPNVMKGYLLSEAPGVLQPPKGGWYDTGDIVAMDRDGYIAIKGRVKRFAKIAGEMVSLAAAEAIASFVYPKNRHAVVAVADQKKGEALVLVTDCQQVRVEELLKRARDTGVTELMVPRNIKPVGSLPALGSGKTDYPAIQRLAVSA